MITQRLALVTVRLIVATVALVYGLLKLFIAPDASPLLGVPAAVAVTLNTPISTNPTFARIAISLGILISGALVTLTIREVLTQNKRFGHVAPYSSPSVIALTVLFSCMAVYYFVIAVISDAQWFYTGTLALIAVILAVYEGKQYADHE
jgi:hypothetical protein